MPEIELKRWKKNGLSFFKLPGRIDILPKTQQTFYNWSTSSRSFHHWHALPCDVTLIAGGGEPGHTNGSGSKARFKNPAGVVVREEELYVCEQGNGTIRVVNMRSLLFNASRIGQEDPHAAESQSEEEDFAIRQIRKVSVRNLSLIPEENVPDLVSPFAICGAIKNNFEL